MFELKILTRFAAAHQLRMVGQKCENLHGHNWKVEVCVGGEHLNEAGVLMDFGDVKRHVADIIREIDHKFLNELEFFQRVEQPSSERIAVHIAQELQKRLDTPGVRVTRVSAWESDDACATYILP
ncbi:MULTISPECIES: 6-carboxytetrahydropterin synthase QueD [Desulfococcus]|uniref:6-carboxy-5,6,7,8-tetrahydropterin synthase n=1 Tax=Desulfococcus multivorans DSM 2059 TaxID=1121405 RepID=S7V5R0_DESML|nr:6-carboxytetrahydropterin synthase QueD [Desulfococcus multivorans]AOY57371.1 QueD: queuosine biosynthesis protein [Desulfococcus multivorans]AQU99816.1 6-carboxytetrahydropterin synthase QueD [Desulfococcus multivorans]EPR41999.1 queuosine biosynthesis protein QueD [Desulfococcus multivorans DSM 2059]MDX9817698.1 6-carboxytetrahydropterin synthase QueD [Desulfococcus multivorans]SKA10563.1 preQ(0) biosynthesis protein QueD [Desulfococcus multivorans DSM 2059]